MRVDTYWKGHTTNWVVHAKASVGGLLLGDISYRRYRR